MDSYRLPPRQTAGPVKRWLQSVLAAVAATGLLVLAFFFAVFALVAAVLLVAVVAARWWWLVRRARKATQSEEAVVEGEYRVVHREVRGSTGSGEGDAPGRGSR